MTDKEKDFKVHLLTMFIEELTESERDMIEAQEGEKTNRNQLGSSALGQTFLIPMYCYVVSTALSKSASPNQTEFNLISSPA